MKPYRIWNRDAIKYIAMLTMLLNHVSVIFMPPDHFLTDLFMNIGYFTAIVMCYFLVEGFHYTRSKKKYAIRLAVFALISQIPYALAFTENGVMEYCGLNMLFTLLICFLILLTVERVSNPLLEIVIVTGLLLLSAFCDWPLLAPIFTLLFQWANGSENKTKAAFILSMFLYGLYIFAVSIGTVSAGVSLYYAFGGMAGIALAGIVIVFLYNGKRVEKGRRFTKWFFYWFYPAHLLILGLIRLWGQ